MNHTSPPAADGELPTPERRRRFRLSLSWELLTCGLRGHALAGTGAAHTDVDDALIVREHDGLRWYRCLRCDTWILLPPPAHPTRDRPPPRDEIPLPLRGRPLRDRIVLRLIAIDRIVHFLAVGALAAGIVLFTHDRVRLRAGWVTILNRLQGGVGGPIVDTANGWLHDIDRLFTIPTSTLYLYGAGIAGYALINLIEAIGLWGGRRWAEYLAVVEVLAFVPIEIDELAARVSPLKVLALIINIAIAVYLLFAHRLFGLRGGGRAYRAEHERDSGWAALERTTPQPHTTNQNPRGPEQPRPPRR